MKTFCYENEDLVSLLKDIFGISTIDLKPLDSFQDRIFDVEPTNGCDDIDHKCILKVWGDIIFFGGFTYKP